MNTFRKMNTRLALSLATGLIAFSPVMVNADSVMVETRTVHYGADSAHSTSGARELYAHIQQAASTVCGVSSADFEPRLLRRPSACVNDAIARADRRVQSSQLARRYIEVNGTLAATENGIDSQILTAQR